MRIKSGSATTTFQSQQIAPIKLVSQLHIRVHKQYQYSKQYLTLCSVNMTYNLKKSIIQWESVCICICLRPRHGSLSVQCVVLVSATNKKISKSTNGTNIVSIRPKYQKGSAYDPARHHEALSLSLSLSLSQDMKVTK